jgi:hypothetical protein
MKLPLVSFRPANPAPPRVRNFSEREKMANKTVFKQVLNSRFTVLDNMTLQDESLSWKATGLLAYMLSMPPDWNFNLSDLSGRKTDGIDATRTGLQELEEAGYVRRYVRRNSDGKISAHVMEVRDSLDTPWEPEEPPVKPPRKTPRLDEPDGTQPSLENPILLSKQDTKEPVTKKTPDTSRAEQEILQVWEAYANSCKRMKTGVVTPRLTSSRKQLIARRLRDYSVDELIQAVTGWENSDWHKGDNPQGKAYNSLELFLRNDKIESFIAMHSKAKHANRQSISESWGRERPKLKFGKEISNREEDFLDG